MRIQKKRKDPPGLRKRDGTATDGLRENRFEPKSGFPQGLKPIVRAAIYGTAEAVP